MAFLLFSGWGNRDFGYEWKQGDEFSSVELRIVNLKRGKAPKANIIVHQELHLGYSARCLAAQ